MLNVKMNLHEYSGSVSSLIGGFRQAAEEQGWDEDTVDKIVIEAKAGNEVYALDILSDYVEPDDYSEESFYLDPLDEITEVDGDYYFLEQEC